MEPSNHRPTYILIDTKSIEKNIRNARAIVSDNKHIFAVVKADGYGHGAGEVATVAVNSGANGLCVATLDEGIFLRNYGLDCPILVMNIVSPNYVDLLIKHHLSATVADIEWLDEATTFMSELPYESDPLKIHLKIDTGMGRIGFTLFNDVAKAAEKLQMNKNFSWEGIYTHFSTADQSDSDYWKKQNLTFNHIVHQLPHCPKYIHKNNTAALLWHGDSVDNMVRFGIGTYGLNPSNDVLVPPFNLAPSLELHSEIVFVKQINSDTGIGYGKKYTAKKDEWIGIVPIGYADGWSRNLTGFHLIVEGQFCEIIGNICMDQLMIKLPKKFDKGTKVTLIGKNHDKFISVQDVANYCGTINYEIVCRLTDRIPRFYI